MQRYGCHTKLQWLERFRNDTLSGRYSLHELPKATPAMADDFPGDDVEGALSERGGMRCAGRMQEDLPIRVSNIVEIPAGS